MKEIPMVCGIMHGNRVSLSAHDQAKPVTVFSVMGHIDRLCNVLGVNAPSTFDGAEVNSAMDGTLSLPRTATG